MQSVKVFPPDGTALGDSGDDLATRVAELERLMGYHSERITALEEGEKGGSAERD